MYALVFRAIFCQIYGQYVQYNLFSTNTNIVKSRMKWNFFMSLAKSLHSFMNNSVITKLWMWQIDFEPWEVKNKLRLIKLYLPVNTQYMGIDQQWSVYLTFSYSIKVCTNNCFFFVWLCVLGKVIQYSYSLLESDHNWCVKVSEWSITVTCW